MKRQKIRKLIIILSMLLFPITIYYFSPALIISAGLEGIINGSFIVFILLFVFSVFFGRAFCSYICPAGALQECAALVNNKSPKQKWRNNIKYIIWFSMIAIVIISYIYKGEILKIDFFYQTEYGISISNVYSYIIYYGIVFLIFIPSILFGKRVFCHYFCWMAPFMIAGTKISNLLHLPKLHISSDSRDCISCGRCNKSCPMSIDVKEEIVKKQNDGSCYECIQCGECIDVCPKKVLKYRFKR